MKNYVSFVYLEVDILPEFPANVMLRLDMTRSHLSFQTIKSTSLLIFGESVLLMAAIA